MPVLHAIADGVWTSNVEVSLRKVMRIPATMTVLALPGNELLLHSPVPMTAERKAEVDALGKVTHLYSPNAVHHLSLGFWADAYPKARVHASKALAKKRPELRIDRFQDSPEPTFDGVIDEVHVDSFKTFETAVLHRSSKTLVLADLVQNMVPSHWFTRLYATLSGVNGKVAVLGPIKKSGFSDRKAMRKQLEQILAFDFDRIIVGHGTVITQNPKEQLARAYDWLG
jgi:hypothetical protein